MNNETSIHIQRKGLKRNTIDKFYTKPSIADSCVDHVRNFVNIQKTDLVIEPSAGNGSFISAIRSLTNNYRFYDIYPAHKDIIKMDYFNVCDEMVNETSSKPIHVIGNPPFGRQSTLAKQFIKRSCEFAQSISFILPCSFKKKSMHKAFHRNFHLVFQTDIPDNSFVVNDVDYTVPCVFQIWEKRDEMRTQPEKIDPYMFHFVKKTGQPDISFRRVGVNAGDIFSDVENKSPQSHNFIQFHACVDIPCFMKLYNSTKHSSKFEENNTVGPKSISKPEMIQVFNALIKNCEP